MIGRAKLPSGRRAPTSLRTGLVMLAVGGLLLYWAFLHALPFVPAATPTTIRADFATATNVNSSTPVRIGGVTVGTVTRLEPADGGRHTIVVMAIGRYARLVHTDATAQIRMRTFVSGSMYIDLDPGSPQAPPLGAATIGLRATGTQVDWDQLNSIFAAQVRTGQQQDIAGLDETVADPSGLRRTLSILPSSLSSIGEAASAVRGQDVGDLPQLIRNTAVTLQALSIGDRLGALVAGAQRTFAATTDQAQALAATLAATPPALQATTVTMHDLDGTISRLAPLVAALAPAAGRVAPTLQVVRPALMQIDRLLAALPPLLAAAPPALRALGDASAAGSPLLRALAPTIARLDDQLLPDLLRVDPSTGLSPAEAIGPAVSGLDSAGSGFDLNGYFLRVDAKLETPNSIIAPCDTGFSGQNAAACIALLTTLSDLGSQAPEARR